MLLEGSDACFAPVLGLDEAAAHPHNLARGSMVEVDGRRQPAAAAPVAHAPARAQSRGAVIGEHTDAVLAELGFDAAAIAVLRQTKACACSAGSARSNLLRALLPPRPDVAADPVEPLRRRRHAPLRPAPTSARRS